MTRRLRTAARLSSKPASPFEREMAGYDAGRRDALADRPRRRFRQERDSDFAEGYTAGYSRVADNGMTGR